mmetsp:Transcript_30870/g.98518  ORF Transcript_30870/g.98518 Transcript_30870/m.98518 type:complete len:440 (-) Transcript_30870:224-1543(-)
MAEPRGLPGVPAPASQRRVLQLVLAHQVSALSLSLLTMQPRAQLLQRALSGDSTAVARHVSRSSVLVALCELLLSPVVGAWSDRAGRRPFMLMAPAVAMPLKLAAAAWPNTAVLLAERVGTDIFRTMGGTTMAYACLSDLFDGEAYTAALGRLNSVSGFGIVCAPLLATAIMGPHGDPSRAYVASAVLAAVHLALGARMLRETKADSKRITPALVRARHSGEMQTGKLCMYPACLNLFTGTAPLRLSAFLFSLHCFIEGKVLQDQVSVLQLSHGWDTRMRSRWTAGLGLAIALGGQATEHLVKRCGEHGFVALCHAASLAAFLALQRSAFWTSLAFLCLGQQRRSASASWLISEARHAGIGQGQAVGWVASLRSAADVSSALLYGAAYRAAAAQGRPARVFALPSALVLLAEALRACIAARRASARGRAGQGPPGALAG